jgi:hypothetical protein
MTFSLSHVIDDDGGGDNDDGNDDDMSDKDDSESRELASRYSYLLFDSINSAYCHVNNRYFQLL